MNKTFNLMLASVVLSLVATPAMAKNDPPEVSIEGLELVEKDRRGEIYGDPDVDWSEYSQIQLERASVAFRKNWKRDQNRYDHFKVSVPRRVHQRTVRQWWLRHDGFHR